ncbi:MAG: hypothetical protein E6561_15800 [Mixta calida]|nr:hypothetical protein [Mixta calida]MDU6415879.1 hypothetical protein [Mixta calida]
MQRWHKADNQADRYRRQQRADRLRIKAAAIPVATRRRRVEQIVHHHLAALNQIEIRQQNAEQRPDKGAQHIQRIVDQLRRLEQVPRRQQHRADGGDHAAGAEADLLRRAVRKVESGRDEVRHDINADSGGDHRQQANRHRQIVAHHADGFNRIGDHLAEQRTRPGNNHHRHQGKQQEVKRQTPAVTATNRLHALTVAREITKIEQRAGKIGDHQRGSGDHLPALLADAQALAGQGESDPGKAGFVYNPARQRQHHHINRRTGDIDKAFNRVHAVPEYRRLQQPHHAKADPAEQRQTEPGSVRQRRQSGPEFQQHQHQRVRGEPGLNAIPGEGD